MHSTLRRLDLNLLLLFDALHRHRSVSLAADDLAISPSACSHGLSRLRAALDDELFIRAGNAMQPTVLAERMAGGVAEALHILSDRLSSAAPFLPGKSDRTFVLAATDYTAYALLPGLMARLEQLAPHLRVKMVYANQQDSKDDLKEGRIHFALGVSHDHAAAVTGLEAYELLVDDYVVVARKGHPRIGETLSLEQYLAERHAVVLPTDDSISAIDLALGRLTSRREVALELPSLMAAPFIIAQSSLLLTMPSLVARQMSATAGLRVLAVPFETPCYTVQLLYHPRQMQSAGNRWMKEMIVSAIDSHCGQTTG